MMKIGVLALQGAFREHVNMLRASGADAIEVRTVQELDEIDGLILPGGESTTMGKLLIELGLKEKLQDRIQKGMPVWGTCAGMILLAKEIDGGENAHLAQMDIQVIRNAYGRQLGSFMEEAKVKGLPEKFPMVFIRAPYIKEAGPEVEILAEVDGRIVAARQGNRLATSFHPELTKNKGMHQFFMDIVERKIS